MPNASHLIFDRSRVRLHRDRAAPILSQVEYLIAAVAERLADRLSDFTRSFPRALDLGAHTGQLTRALQGREGTELLVQSDLSYEMLCRSLPPSLTLPHKGGGDMKIVADEECLPFAEDSFDLVLSAWSLHWANDLPGALAQIRRALKPGGLFMATLPGGRTLSELRASLEKAEIEDTGGVSPRISPFVDVRNAAGLLQRAGFADPVADGEMLTVFYPHPLQLLRDLRGMGETSALLAGAKGFTPAGLLLAASEHYRKHFSHDEGIAASFELVTMTGWKA